MNKLKVYISSTFLDMEPLRKQILAEIQGGLPEWFEFTEVMERMKMTNGNGENRPSIDVCLANVREADIYVLLTGKRYGSWPESYSDAYCNLLQNTEKKSYTWLEYETACDTRKKRRHIYQLEITDDFFEKAGLNSHTDLDDEEKRVYFEKFKQVYSVAPREKAGTFMAMNLQMNRWLTRSNLIFNTIKELKITDKLECSINRHQQFEVLTNKSVGASAVTSLIISAKDHNDDEVGLFMKRLRDALRPNENYGNVENTHWVDLTNVLSGSGLADQEKIRQTLLLESWYNITGARPRQVTFQTLTSQIDRIQNRFLGFIINFTPDNELINTLIGHFCDFVQHLNALLTTNNFDYNFFIVLCVNSDQKLNKPNIDGHVKLTTELHDLGRLSPVSLEDIDKWLDLVVEGENDGVKDRLNKTKNDIMKDIFVDLDAFPKSYRLCLKDIKSRTK